MCTATCSMGVGGAVGGRDPRDGGEGRGCALRSPSGTVPAGPLWPPPGRCGPRGEVPRKDPQAARLSTSMSPCDPRQTALFVLASLSVAVNATRHSPLSFLF